MNNICINCGNEFDPILYQKDGKKARIQKYCSVKCRAHHDYIIHREDRLRGVKEYVAKNREHILAHKRQQWYRIKNDPVKYKRYLEKRKINGRANRIKLLYGITLEQYYEMAKEQNYLCKICFRPMRPQGNTKELVIDHNHKTDQVRGLLCNNCNIALGLLEDNVDYMMEMIKYVKSYE